MCLRVLRKTNGHIGGIGMLHDMRVFLIPLENGGEYGERVEREAVHVHCKRFVRAGETEDVPHGLLGGDALRLLEEREGDSFNGSQC